MNNISFKSTIRPINRKQFNNIVLNYGLKNSVDYPWTIKETIISKNAYTSGVYDCTVCGIKDGTNIIMMHICPTRKENYYFSKISDYIKSLIDLKNPKLQGFLLGSKRNVYDCSSELLFKNFEKFFKDNNIEYSKLEGGPCTHNVAYSALTDEWLISNEATEKDLKKYSVLPEEFFKSIFHEIKLSDKDKFCI